VRSELTRLWKAGHRRYGMRAMYWSNCPRRQAARGTSALCSSWTTATCRCRNIQTRARVRDAWAQSVESCNQRLNLALRRRVSPGSATGPTIVLAKRNRSMRHITPGLRGIFEDQPRHRRQSGSASASCEKLHHDCETARGRPRPVVGRTGCRDVAVTHPSDRTVKGSVLVTFRER